MSYLDLDVEIEEGSGGRDYRVVARSAAGDTRGVLHFPYDELALESQLDKLQIALLRSGGPVRRALSTEEQAVQDFGHALFLSLFSEDVRGLYDASRLKASQEGKDGVRLRLRILAPELAALPWEYLYDARQHSYLCLSRGTPLVRYPELAQPMTPLRVTPPLRILGMIASPSDLDPLDVEREQERMRQALTDLEAQGLVQLEWLPGQTWRHLQRAMRGGPWHIFHFIGHGGFHQGEGVLALAGDEGKTSLLSATQLGILLANHSPLRLAMLNACEGARGDTRDLFSSTAATLSRRGLPAVLAMQYNITDRAAIEYTRTFYEALADQLPVDAALAEARAAIHLGVHNSLEWGTPVLYLRAPDGILFDLVGQPMALAVVAKQAEARPGPTLPSAMREAGAQEAERQERERQERVQEERLLREAAIPVGTSLAILNGPCELFTVAWSPDGRLLAAGGREGPVLLWNAASGEKFEALESDTGVTGVAWSPDGTRLAYISGVAQLLDMVSRKPLAILQANNYAVAEIAWSPDGKRLASAGSDGTLCIWDTSSYQQLAIWSAGTYLYSVAWSPDGRHLASGCFDQTVRLWDASSGMLLATLRGHTDVVFSVAWSPDGAWLASASGNSRNHQADIVLLWDTSSWQARATLKGHSSEVVSVAWSPDGKRLASASRDFTVRLWDATSGKPLATLRGHTEPVYAIAWSPDGQRLASASADQTVRIWKV